jgi:hypothetical protein
MICARSETRSVFPLKRLQGPTDAHFAVFFPQPASCRAMLVKAVRVRLHTWRKAEESAWTPDKPEPIDKVLFAHSYRQFVLQRDMVRGNSQYFLVSSAMGLLAALRDSTSPTRRLTKPLGHGQFTPVSGSPSISKEPLVWGRFLTETGLRIGRHFAVDTIGPRYLIGWIYLAVDIPPASRCPAPRI